MIPTIDPKVRFVGSSYLRGLNSEQLRQLTGAVVVQDSGDQPLVVIVPYETYLALQQAVRVNMEVRAFEGLMTKDQALSAANSEPPARELLVELDGEDG